jgi:CRP-like cAMP-binding protein
MTAVTMPVRTQLHLTRRLQLYDPTLPADALRRLTDAADGPVTVRAGGEFVVQGSRPNQSTIMVAGWARRFTSLLDGRRQTLALQIAGDFVDLHSFPLKVMDHGVAAITDCVIATVPHETLRDITESDPHLTRVLWLSTLADAAILRQWLTGSAQRTSLEHAAHLVCELYCRHEAVGLASAEHEFPLPLTQSQLGDALGITSVHVSRTFTELKKARLLTWSGGQLRILDWAGLKTIAQFDDTYLSLHGEPR